MTLANTDKELEQMENMGVIEKNYYSPWARPTVHVKKKTTT